MFDIPGYKFITANREDKTGGGVGIYIKEKIEFKIRKDLSIFKEDTLESIFVEFKTNDKRETVVVGTLYRPPNGNFKELI